MFMHRRAGVNVRFCRISGAGRAVAPTAGADSGFSQEPLYPGPTVWFAVLGCPGGGLVHALVSLLLPVPDVPEVNSVRVPVP